ncbi:hypothetical protein RCR42_11010 [Enterobacter hormaechei]|nr:hypothetical protein [Enterobacter hormaechei]MEC5417638.1 hypothetical protein [Enterobacter hormaechei]WMQ88867.1 hypothetical protein RCR42_11010 [Enterobacter hormaechei]
MSISPLFRWPNSVNHYKALRPGMVLEGDVSLDTRNLWEWLTEPLWSLKGKL